MSHPSQNALSFTVFNSKGEQVDPEEYFGQYPWHYLHWNLNKFIEGKVENGKVLYKINPHGSDDIRDASSLIAAITESSNAWQSVETTAFRIENGGLAILGFNEYDNSNTVFWDEKGGIDPHALALTKLSWDSQTGEILDADIGFNGFKVNSLEWKKNHYIQFKIQWTMEDIQKFDWLRRKFIANVQATLTHEFGHLLGLGHSAVAEATMHVPAPNDNTSQRSLESDDREGVTFLYPYWLSFVEGNPGIPGDGAFINSTYKRIYGNPSRGWHDAWSFRLSNPIPLSNFPDSITIIAFPSPQDFQNVDYFQIGIDIYSPIACYSFPGGTFGGYKSTTLYGSTQGCLTKFPNIQHLLQDYDPSCGVTANDVFITDLEIKGHTPTGQFYDITTLDAALFLASPSLRIINIDPATVVKNQEVTLTLTGAGFQRGFTAAYTDESMPGYSFFPSNADYVDTTTLKITLSIWPGPTSTMKMFIRNPTGEVATINFTALASP